MHRNKLYRLFIVTILLNFIAGSLLAKSAGDSLIVEIRSATPSRYMPDDYLISFSIENKSSRTLLLNSRQLNAIINSGRACHIHYDSTAIDSAEHMQFIITNVTGTELTYPLVFRQTRPRAPWSKIVAYNKAFLEQNALNSADTGVCSLPPGKNIVFYTILPINQYDNNINWIKTPRGNHHAFMILNLDVSDGTATNTVWLTSRRSKKLDKNFMRKRLIVLAD